MLRERTNPESLVVGIYGTWGEGKTTVLNYVEQALQGADDVAVVPFNPWRYPAEVLDAGWVETDYVLDGVEGHQHITLEEAAARQFMVVHERSKATSSDPGSDESM